MAAPCCLRTHLSPLEKLLHCAKVPDAQGLGTWRAMLERLPLKTKAKDPDATRTWSTFNPDSLIVCEGVPHVPHRTEEHHYPGV